MRLNRRTLLLFASILAVAAGLRFYALTDIPYTLWVDEAWFELRGREVLTGGNPWPTVDTVFAIGNSPFQMYAAALAQALGAPAAYSSRWASATAGVLAVPATFFLLHALFAAEWADERREVAALAGAALMATLFAALLYSRDGTQNMGCVLATALVMVGLHQTFRPVAGAGGDTRRSYGWAIFTGAALAVAQTTYEAALALPIVVAGYALARALTACAGGWRPAVRLAAVVFTVALGVYAPLLAYYGQHPEVVLNRLMTTQSLTDAGGLERVLRPLAGYARVGWGLVAQGDRLFGQNLSGHPLLDPFTSLSFGLGMLEAARRVRASAAAQLLLIAALALALPSAVTANPPAFTRMLPMLPALAGLAGWGAALIWGWASARGAVARRAGAALLVAGFAAAGAFSIYDYFVVWANHPRLFDARQVGARRTVDLALAAARDGDVWLTPRSNPLIQYTFAVALDGTRVRTFDGEPACLPYAHVRPEATAYGVVVVMSPEALPALKTAYPSGDETAHVMHPDGYAYAVFFRVPPGTPAPAPRVPVAVELQGGLRLVGLDAPGEARPGETVALRLHWEASWPLAGDLTGFVHLGRGRESRPMIAQHDGPLCPGLPPDRWQPGYRYIETRSLTVAADAPTGLYDLRVGVYDPATGVRLEVLEADVPVEDNRVILAPFEVL